MLFSWQIEAVKLIQRAWRKHRRTRRVIIFSHNFLYFSSFICSPCSTSTFLILHIDQENWLQGERIFCLWKHILLHPPSVGFLSRLFGRTQVIWYSNNSMITVIHGKFNHLILWSEFNYIKWWDYFKIKREGGSKS